MSALIVRNEIVHYEVLGRGRPVIFLHSWVGSWRDWILTMQAASSTYRCYALDLWGFGDTAKEPGRYKPEEQVRLVEDFIERLGIRKVALLGHGLGGVVAARFTRDQPTAVDRLMLVNVPVEAAAINARLQTTGVADLGLWIYAGLQGGEVYRLEAEKAAVEAIHTSLEGCGADELARITGDLKIPSLIVRCENDPAIDAASPAPVFERGGPAHQITFETGGHHPMLREPVAFSRLSMDFLGLQSGSSPADLQLKDEWKRRYR